jgi:hypothetical protein
MGLCMATSLSLFEPLLQRRKLSQPKIAPTQYSSCRFFCEPPEILLMIRTIQYHLTNFANLSSFVNRTAPYKRTISMVRADIPSRSWFLAHTDCINDERLDLNPDDIQIICIAYNILRSNCIM